MPFSSRASSGRSGSDDSGNGKRSRRHTIVGTASSGLLALGLAPLDGSKPGPGHAGESTDSRPTPDKRKRRKSVTFTPVDKVLFIPPKEEKLYVRLQPLSVASSPPQASKSAEVLEQNISSNPTSPTSGLPSGISGYHAMDGPDDPSGRSRRRRNTAPSFSSRFLSSPQDLDFNSYPPIDWQESLGPRPRPPYPHPQPSPSQTKGRHTVSDSPADNHHLLVNGRRCSPPFPSESFPYSSEELNLEYTVHQLTFPYSHAERLALPDTRTASLVPSSFPPPESPGTFAISYAPNEKGLGMFAQKSLHTGEVIVAEVPTQAPNFRPNIVLAELIDLAWGSDYGEVDGYMLGLSLPLLSAPSYSSPSGFDAYHGIFLTTSRCNHSCAPNAKLDFDPSTLVLFLTCLRPINEGDEITIAYVSPFLPFDRRRSRLHNVFGFDCACDHCLFVSQAKETIDASNSARIFLSNFWDEYPQNSNYSANDLISKHMLAMKLIILEGLPTCYTRESGPVPVDTIQHAEEIALLYGALADGEKFPLWVARTLDAQSYHSGCGDAQTHSTQTTRVRKEWITSPQTFPDWGSRWSERLMGLGGERRD